MATCRGCGTALLADAAFCFTCGTPVSGASRAATPASPATSERRLTSVMFADLVSYTTLSESRDTEDVRELLSRYFEVCSTVVRRYGGTIEKFIGDAVMAVWGVPTAHEDDAERAVRAALELIDAVAELGVSLGIPELSLRAGVVTGQVAANLGATDQGMVAGDAVNTAARVQAAAGPGEVWVDAVTRGLTAAGMTHVDVGVHALKGKAEPVQLYRVGTVVAAVGGTQRVDGLEAPLAGRERELRMVKELFHATVESGRPRLVILDGEAGIGKTRLAWEFEKYSSGIETDTFWHRGRCLSYGDGVVYWALAEAVRTRVGLVEETPDTDVSDHVEEALKEWVPDDDERSWLRPRLVALVGGEHGDYEREDLFAAWTTFFERLADHGEAVTLLIDDAQYADQGLTDFLEHLVANARTPMFVLLLARPELLEEHPQLGGRRAARVPLEPLNDSAMETLVAGLVDGLPDEARAALVARAEGIPLYAVETVRTLIDREIVRPEEGRYVVAPGAVVDLADVAAPASLHALVASRLDALSPDERRVVGDASVIGATFTREGIEFLCADVPDLEGVLSRLQRKELIGTDNDRFSAERGQFRFEQAVVRQVAYATLSRRARKERHLAVADHLERAGDRQGDISVVAAQHLLDAIDAAGADDPDVPELNRRAAALLVVAGERAARLGSYAAAVTAFRKAATRMPEGPERADAVLQAAAACDVMARHVDQVELGLEAHALFLAHGDPVGAGRCAITVSRGHLLQGDVAAAIDVARQAYDTLTGVEDTEDVQAALAIALAFGLNRWDGDAKEILGYTGEALRLAEISGDTAVLFRAMRFLSSYQAARGSSRVAAALNREMISFARAEEQWMPLTYVLLNQSLMRRVSSLPDALDLLNEAYTTGRQHGIGVHGIAANLATVLWASGRWADHEALLRDAAEDWDAITGPDQILYYATDLWRQEAGFPELVPQPASSSDDLNWRAWDSHVRALRALAAGDRAVAGKLGAESLSLSLADAGVTDDYPVQAPRMMRLALAADDRELAAVIVSQLEHVPKGLDSPGLRAYELTFRGLLACRSGLATEQDEADLRRGIEQLDAYGAIPDRALAQEDLGRWLIERGRADEAAPLLAAARATYDELGASAWLARVDAPARIG
jgi:class 3 adenylate cyclase/tetratricopeptide (TPR) repeat protein